MNTSRRRFLGSTLGVSLFWLAGCGSSGDGSNSGDGGGGGGGGGGDGGDTATPGNATQAGNETQATTETATEAPSPLVQDTDAAVGEALWFANRYNTTIYQYEQHVTNVEELIVAARESDELTEAHISEIDAKAQEFSRFLREDLGPHFPKVDDIVGTTRHYVDQLEKFRRRGDSDRVDQELSRFRRYYDGLGADSFVADRFTDVPVGEPLYSMLAAANVGSGAPVFSIGHPGGNYLTTVRTGGSIGVRPRAGEDLQTDEVDTYLRKLEVLFEDVQVSAGRTERLFVEAFVTGPRPSRPIYVQVYDGADAAESALTSALEAGVVETPDATFGRSTWKKVFYRRNLDVKHTDSGYAVYDRDEGVVYDEAGRILAESASRDIFDRDEVTVTDADPTNLFAYLTRIGPYLVAASPSLTAWEERPSGAETGLRKSWLVA